MQCDARLHYFPHLTSHSTCHILYHHNSNTFSTSDITLQCAVRCGGVMLNQSRCCGVTRCGIWCGVRYAVVLNVVCCGIVVDVEWCKMWTVAVWRCGTCGGVKWWCRGRLQCNVMVVRGEICDVECCAMVVWCGVVWNGVMCGMMCDVITFNVVWTYSVMSNAIWTLLIT